MNGDPNEFNRDELFALADLVISGEALEEQVQQLDALLQSNPLARREYLRYAFVHGQLPLTAPALPRAEVRRLLTKDVSNQDPCDDKVGARRVPFLAAALSLAAALLLAIWLAMQFSSGTPTEVAVELETVDPAAPGTATYDNRVLPVESVATLGPNESGPTTLKIAAGESRFASAGGADVRLEGPTTFGVNSSDGGVLFDGSVSARVNRPETSFSVQTSNLRFVDLGTEFRVSVVDHERVSVHVLDGEVDVQSRIRLPLYFWTFDMTREAPVPDHDVVSRTPLTVGSAAQFTNGIIGNGALRCDNTPDAFVKIEGGTGNKVGTGNLACSSGITIEAMFISEWSGRVLDYDEFFRKEDGVYRMLLSFQNDDNVGDYDTPDVELGPCLSFGLHLEGIGYSELDMPLDGREGRPTVAELTDGKPHHVVASYDSYTGEKSIYIDGQLRFQHVFPVGTLILCGGPTKAEIGNYFRSEPFRGVIDEVAFYDFALTSAEVAEHYHNASAGMTYFGLSADNLPTDRWQSVTTVGHGGRRVFNKESGLAIDDQ